MSLSLLNEEDGMKTGGKGLTSLCDVVPTLNVDLILAFQVCTGRNMRAGFGSLT